MNEGRWVLAKIAAVHLRLPDLGDEAAARRVLGGQRALTTAAESSATRTCKIGLIPGSELPHRKEPPSQKRDVSDEPRVPAGQPGGGEWVAEDGGRGSRQNDRNIIPVQAVPAPMPLPFPIPFEFPVSPTEISPFLDIPNGEFRDPIPTNPYPDDPDCAVQWAHAHEFCNKKLDNKELRPGYSGWGKNFVRCVMGMVSQACGGNATGA